MSYSKLPEKFIINFGPVFDVTPGVINYSNDGCEILIGMCSNEFATFNILIRRS